MMPRLSMLPGLMCILLFGCVDDLVLPPEGQPVGPPVTASIFSSDTLVQVGATFHLEAEAYDSAGTRLAAGLTWNASGPAVQVTPDGTVTARAFGVSFVRASADANGPYLDSIRVAVVPRATLAWVGSGGVRLGDLTGRSQLLTPGEGRHLAVSPSGTRWVFGERIWTYLVDPDGTTHLVKIPLSIGPQWPRFSADGQWLYVAGHAFNENTRIYRVRLHGSFAEPVAPAISDKPSPSPDGRQVAYRGGPDLRVADVATGAVTQLKAQVDGLRWSPDGQWIAFTDATPGLGLIHPDGTGLRRVGTSLLEDAPDWSPDSRFAIGVDARTGHMTVFEIATGITLDLGWKGRYPAWSNPSS